MSLAPLILGTRRKFGEQQRFMLLLIAPAAILMLLFQVAPIVIGANASFRDWALNHPKKTWVGLQHYIHVLTDPAFLQVVLPNTFVFMVLSVSLALMAGLAVALLLNRPFRGQKLVQTVLLLPLMVAPVIAAIRLALNQNQPVSNSRFHAKIETMTGQRREAKHARQAARGTR